MTAFKRSKGPPSFAQIGVTLISVKEAVCMTSIVFVERGFSAHAGDFETENL
jgi:hypothetical protein